MGRIYKSKSKCAGHGSDFGGASDKMKLINKLPREGLKKGRIYWK